MTRDVIVIKCGGSVSLDPTALCADIAGLAAAGRTVVLVHGGSADIEQLAARLRVPMARLASMDGQTARFTDPASLEVVTLALAGIVQPRLVSALLAAGVQAVGLTGVQGGLLRARRRRAQRALVKDRQVVVRGDHSGRVTSVNTCLLDCLTGAGFVPVVSPPVLAEDDGSVLNANADRVAAAVAAATQASTLLLLTAAPGVLADPSDPRSVMPVCPVPAEGPPPLRGGGIGVKLLAAREALAAGVAEVLIADGTVPLPVSRALGGAATRVTLTVLDPAVSR